MHKCYDDLEHGRGGTASSTRESKLHENISPSVFVLYHGKRKYCIAWFEHHFTMTVVVAISELVQPENLLQLHLSDLKLPSMSIEV